LRAAQIIALKQKENPRRWNQLPANGITGAATFKRSPALNRKEIAMDWNRIEGNWKQFKGKVKEQWGHLTDDDLDRIAGKREQLEGKIQERSGIGKDAVRKQVDDWLNKQ
jgi:uncharacterized protein YjbJ (UPF0337 family)